MRRSAPQRPRRRFKRRTVRVLVDFHTPTGARYEYATTLGPGGLFVETEQPLEPGTPVKVRFRLTPNDPLHEIEGRVAWVNEPARGAGAAPGMGVEFTDAGASAALGRELERIP